MTPVHLSSEFPYPILDPPESGVICIHLHRHFRSNLLRKHCSRRLFSTSLPLIKIYKLFLDVCLEKGEFLPLWRSGGATLRPLEDMERWRHRWDIPIFPHTTSKRLSAGPDQCLPGYKLLLKKGPIPSCSCVEILYIGTIPRILERNVIPNFFS